MLAAPLTPRFALAEDWPAITPGVGTLPDAPMDPGGDWGAGRMTATAVADESFYQSGGLVTFRVRVRNGTPSTLHGVRVTGYAPVGGGRRPARLSEPDLRRQASAAPGATTEVCLNATFWDGWYLPGQDEAGPSDPPAMPPGMRDEGTVAAPVRPGWSGRGLEGDVLVSYLVPNGPEAALGRGGMTSADDGQGNTLWSPDDPSVPLRGSVGVDAAEVRSASLSVADDRGTDVWRGDVAPGPDGSFSVPGVGLLRGENGARLDVALWDGTYRSDSLTLLYGSDDRAAALQVDRSDPDGDGLVNYLEHYYGTDPAKADTDGDGLGDLTELARLDYDPTEADTDGNGIADGDEDRDGDGISNLGEIEGSTNLVWSDSDADGLLDGDELSRGTDPDKVDTDGDGLRDGWEADHGTDPLAADAAPSFAESRGLGGGVSATMSLTAPAASAEGASVLPLPAEPAPLEGTPGFLAGCEPVVPEGATGTITLSLPAGTVAGGVRPVAHRYDRESQSMTTVPTTVDGDSVTFPLGAPAAQGGDAPQAPPIYLVVDENSFDSVWDQDVRDPGQASAGDPYDFCFVLDRSNSMEDNDPGWYRRSAVREFVARMRGDDRAAVVTFTASARTDQPLTSDKAALGSAVDGLTNDSGWNWDSGTNGTAGLDMAESLLGGSEGQRRRAVFFLTDGDDNRSSDSYASLAQRFQTAATPIYVFLLGPDISGPHADELQTLADQTGGKLYHGAQEDMSKLTGELFDETVDYATDSNGDGISDYYTKLICDGRIGLANGTFPYKGIDFGADPDYDHDGIPNGDEVRVAAYYDTDVSGARIKRLFLHKKSDPTVADANGTDVEGNEPSGLTSRKLAMFAALSYADGSPGNLEDGFYRHPLRHVAGEEQPKEGNENPDDVGERYLFYNRAHIWNGDGSPGEDHYITDWRIADYADWWNLGPLSKFSATTYVNDSERTAVLAYRGTSETAEWANDAAGLLFNTTLEEPQAILYMEEQVGKLPAGYKIYITGHSLGGYLAQVAAAQLVIDHGSGSLTGVEYFNGMGFNYGAIVRKLIAITGHPLPDNIVGDASQALWGSSLASYRALGGHDVCRRTYGDPVSLLGMQSGEVKTSDADMDCVRHHQRINNGTQYDILSPAVPLLPVVTGSPETALAHKAYEERLELEGLGPMRGGWSYFWSVHETDSFMYNLPRGGAVL